MQSAIDVSDLRKVYPDGTEALKGIKFQVQPGEFFGFLGPNGAGKSTTIKILITLLGKTGGEARVLGLDTDHDAKAIRRRIGYAAQETGIDDDLTGRENLTLQGQLYHLPSDLLRRRVDELLTLMDLTGDADRSAGAYSGGMRKRLDLATGLIHRPEILFLDEPTTGLDPQTRANLWKYLERLNTQEGLTIFLTTHYMEEADRLCRRLAIIDHGRLMAEGSPEDLKARLGGDIITIRFKENGATPQAMKLRGTEVLQGIDLVREVTDVDQGLNVVVQDGGSSVPHVLHALDNASLPVEQLSLSKPTLDEVFMKYTGHSIRDEELNGKWRSSRMGGPFQSRRRRLG
jgi:ABC-2 type transport system ATP-binding protein